MKNFLAWWGPVSTKQKLIKITETLFKDTSSAINEIMSTQNGDVFLRYCSTWEWYSFAHYLRCLRESIVDETFCCPPFVILLVGETPIQAYHTCMQKRRRAGRIIIANSTTDRRECPICLFTSGQEWTDCSPEGRVYAPVPCTSNVSHMESLGSCQCTKNVDIDTAFTFNCTPKYKTAPELYF